MTEHIGFDVSIDAPYERAIERVTSALKDEGFGILTRIDVRATLKEKLGEEFRPYVILGACNPHLAHRALSHDGRVGVMLPCNVTVETTPQGGTLVRIGNPDVMLLGAGDLARDTVLRDIAREAREKLERAAEALKRA